MTEKIYYIASLSILVFIVKTLAYILGISSSQIYLKVSHNVKCMQLMERDLMNCGQLLFRQALINPPPSIFNGVI